MIKRESHFFWNPDPSVCLEAFLPVNGENKPALIILPGGAYFALSDREGAEVAEYFAGKGYPSFVLRYSTMHPSFSEPETPVNPHTVFPEPLHETAAAVKFIRDRAAMFGVDPMRIALMGFSAGGHLAANYCNEWSGEDICGALAVEAEDIRPNACILCYAATKLHRASQTMNLAVFGERENYSEQLLSRWCAAENINRNTPPTFIWHTATDRMVPVSHSYEMAQALFDEGVPHELHIFSEGDHAMGLSLGLPAEPWKELAISFVERYT